MKDTLKIFNGAGRSKKSIISTDLDSIRSTLFGKFYEGIIARWLVEKEGYKHQNGKPCVYWDKIEKLKFTDNFYSSLNKSLKNKKEHNKHTNSDGLFQKNEEYFLWEAKHWAKWNEGKILKQQVEDLLGNSPWLLTKKVKSNGKEIDIHGILFSWWQEFEGYDSLEKNITKIINLSFKFYFTSNIIDDCRKNKYDWYQKLINEQKENIEEFFKELLGEK